MKQFYPMGRYKCSWLPASIPGLQFLITCSMQEWREKAWRILLCDLWHVKLQLVLRLSSRNLLTAKPCTTLILHFVLAMRMGQKPAESYTKCIECTQARSHDFKGPLIDKLKMLSNDTIFLWSERSYSLELHRLYHSHLSTSIFQHLFTSIALVMPQITW